MALAVAIARCYGYLGTFAQFTESRAARRLRVLEINEAGHLTQFFAKMRKHTLAKYPDVDMTAMPYPCSSYDLVVHSDTLEHVCSPISALAECRRVLVSGGFCAFTVPMIVDRMNASRAVLPPSYHGSQGMRNKDYIVHTEYGSDAWKHVILAGFSECRVVAAEYPAALALVGAR